MNVNAVGGRLVTIPPQPRAVRFLEAIGLLHPIPFITASVRRLHDAGLSGWSVVIALLPVLGPAILVVLLAKRSAPLDPELSHLGYDWEDDKRFAEPFTSHRRPAN